MTDIFKKLHKFVPKEQVFQVMRDDGETEPACIQVDYFNYILIGGDKFTVARIRECQRGTVKLSLWRGMLGGLIPVVEDWHTKL